MNSTRLLISIAAMLLVQYCVTEEAGENSDEVDPLPLMNTNPSIGEKKQGIPAAAPPLSQKKEETKSGREAVGSVEKGDKVGGSIEGKKNLNVPSQLTTKVGTTTSIASAQKNTKEVSSNTKPAGVSSTEQIGKMTSTEKTTSAVKVDSLRTISVAKPLSTEKEGKEEEKKEGDKQGETKIVAPEVDDKTTQGETTTVLKSTVTTLVVEDSGENKDEMVDGEGEDKSEEPEEPVGEKVKTEEKKEGVKKEEKGREERPYPKQPIAVEYYSDSHFFSYFIFFIVISAAGYLAFHNKRKIMALLIEGRSSKGGRVRYHRLANDDNFERNVIY